jgi:hypothetical protein
MLHVGLPAMRDGRRPEVRTPGITQKLYLHSRVLHAGTTGRRSGRVDLPDVPDVSRGTAGDARRPTPRVETPGLTRMGRPRPCSAVDARKVGHATTRPPLGLQRRSAAAPAGMHWMFHVEPDAVSRRSADPDAWSGLSDEGSAAMLGDRCSSIRAARFHPEPRWSSVAVAGRSGCPDGLDVSRGTGGSVERDGALRSGRPDRMSRRGTAAILYGAGARRPGYRQPIRFQTELCRCSRAGAADSDAPDGLDVSRGTGAQRLVGRGLQFGRQDRMGQ